MKRALFALVAGLVLMAVPAVATAQSKTKPAKKKSDDCAEQRKTNKDKQCNLVIDGDDLTGDVIRPGGDEILARPDGGPQGSLIRVRTTFVDKLSKTTEQF